MRGRGGQVFGLSMCQTMQSNHDPAAQGTPQNGQAAIDYGARGGELSHHIFQIRNSLPHPFKLAVHIGLIRQKFRARDGV